MSHSVADKSTTVTIIGAGPAGLTAAYLLTKRGINVIVLEADPTYVGGISRTVNYKGYCFDIGGHRFFSKSKEVEDLWTELLPKDMLDRPRSSRIFYRGKYFAYPLKAFEALFKLGIIESIRCVLSYAKARLYPVQNPKNFQDWVSNQFGRRLFNVFFKTYTEKVWGMSCVEISADWAAQRIKGLSLASAILNAILPKRESKDRQVIIKTLIDSFRYPRKGPGMMWEAALERTKRQGGVVMMGTKAAGLRYESDSEKWYTLCVGQDGKEIEIESTHVISTAPMRELVGAISPKMKTTANAEKLRYRDFITVAVMLKDRQLFDDNWLYIHDPSVKVGRIQNFKSWSPELIPDPSMVCYGLEYFCFEGDGLWNSEDSSLIELAKSELEQLGLAKKSDILDGCVVRQPKAYPVYDDDYASNVAAIRAEINAHYPRLHLVGRNGMHKYNNQDHAMMTAMLTVENIVRGRQVFDIWQVNQDAEYHEAGSAGSQNAALNSGRLVPARIT